MSEHKKHEEEVEVAYDADFDAEPAQQSGVLSRVVPQQSSNLVSLSITPKKLFFLGLLMGLLVIGLPALGYVVGSNTGTKGGGLALGGNDVAGAQNAPAPAQPPGAPEYAAAPGKVKGVSKEDHIYGDPKAQMTIIEYSDTECPYCKRFHLNPKQVVDDSKGKVNLVFRHFPLSFHQNASKEAEATECVASIGGNDKFWKYIDKIFEKTTSGGTGFALDNLTPLAKEVGVDEKKFKECLDGGKMAQKVQADFAEGQAAGVDGTPGNILLRKDGKNLLVPGAVSAAELKAEIEKLASQK